MSDRAPPQVLPSMNHPSTWLASLGVDASVVSLEPGSAPPPASTASAFVAASPSALPSADQARAALAAQPEYTPEPTQPGLAAQWWKRDRRALSVPRVEHLFAFEGAVLPLGEGRVVVGWDGAPGSAVLLVGDELLVIHVENSQAWFGRVATPPLPSLPEFVGDGSLPEAAKPDFQARAASPSLFERAVAGGLAVRHAQPPPLALGEWSPPPAFGTLSRWLATLPAVALASIEQRALAQAGELRAQLVGLDKLFEPDEPESAPPAALAARGPARVPDNDADAEAKASLALADLLWRRELLACAHETLRAAGRGEPLSRALALADDAARARIHLVVRLARPSAHTRAASRAEPDAWWGLHAWT
jgi:hypothetical protein